MRTKLRRAAGTILAATVAGLALVAVFGSAASAGPRSGRVAAARNPVVPPGGTVAGKGYGYWLGRTLRTAYATSSSAPPACTVVSVGGQRVAMLRAGSGSTGGAVTCSEPAGRALSVGGPAWTCSTLQGDHAGFGTTPADLEKCARSNFKHDLAGVSHSVTLDGRPTRQVLIASGVFYVPKVVRGGLCSSPCVAAPTAHAAGYGYEVLLSGLSKGTHIIDFKVASFAATVYTIDVR